MSINVNDFKHIARPNSTKKDKVYRLFCDSCGVDRGYKAKYLAVSDCNSCASKKKMETLSLEDKSKRGRYAVS